jgi:hypothetical protein
VKRSWTVWASVALLVAFVARIAYLGLDSIYDTSTLAMYWLLLAALFALLIYGLERPLRFWITWTVIALVPTLVATILAFGVDSDLGNATAMTFWFLVAALLALLTYGLARGPTRK